MWNLVHFYLSYRKNKSDRLSRRCTACLQSSSDLTLEHQPAILLCLRPPHRTEALSDAFVSRLSVWRVAYIGPNSRTERPRKTKIGRGTPRHTWVGHHFQGQKVKGQLVADVLNNQHAGNRYHLANTCEDIVNLQGADCAATRTACCMLLLLLKTLIDENNT